MKPSKYISDEELAAYLDQILSNQSMLTNSMCDIDTLEVLSVAREASKHTTQQKITSLPSWTEIPKTALRDLVNTTTSLAQAGFLGDLCAEDEVDNNDVE
jgi:hypothetical protein